MMGESRKDASDGETAFLFLFYKAFAGCGFAGTAGSWIFAGFSAGSSFGLGFLAMAAILGSLHVSMRFMLSARPTSWQWETFLVFVRYGLLGVGFYAMMSLLEIRWPWFLGGTTVLLPGLFIALLLDRVSPKL